MPNSFEIVDTIWRKEDAFDEVLNGNLFEAINGLQQVVSGNDPVWAKVVFEILYHYLTGFFFYHFCFSYGDPQAYKPERQRDLEHHIRKLLQTEARDLISKICISSLHGKGWQTLYEIRPWRFPFTLNPLRLYRRFLGRLYIRFLRWLQKTPSGAGMGLEIFGLFDHYTTEEFNELLLYVQHYARNKLPHEFNEWEILYTVRLMTRPYVLPQQEHDTLVDQILSIEFTREGIRMEILAELAKSSDKAVEALGAYQYLNPKHLITSAHINPLAMKTLISHITPRSSVYNAEDLLDKLGRLEKPSAEVLLQIDPSEEDAYASAVLIATSVSALTIEARELLTSHLNSSDYHLRYLAACALLQTARTIPVERAKVFNSILEIAIGPTYLEVSQEAYERRDPLQKKAVQFLIDLAENDPFLIRTFLKALRNTWKHEFAKALGRFFSGCEIADDVFDKVVDHLLDGNLSEVRVSAKQLCSELLEFLIGFPLDQIAANDFLPYALNDDDSPTVELVRVCAGYTMHVWPCLLALVDHIYQLKSPHFAVFAALLALDKPSRQFPNAYSVPVMRHSSYATKPEDSYVSICQDLSSAISILESLDEVYILNFLTDLEQDAEYRRRAQIMWSLRFFPHANHTIMSLIKKGLADPNRDVYRATQEALYSLPYLDVDGIELIIDMIVSPDQKSSTTTRDELMERLQPIAPSAILRVVEVLRQSSDVTVSNSSHKIRSRLSDDVTEFWLVEYCLHVLKFVPQEGTEYIELYKQKLRVNYSWNDLRRHLRPYFILALGRVRPVTSETVKMLLNFTKPGQVRVAIRSVRNFDFPEIKMAAAIALSEIGSDLTNGVDWNTRNIIANHLIWSAKQPIQSKSTFVGGKDIFPKDPNDAMYQSAKTMALVIKDHKAREQVATKGITSLE